jgi:HlyD family secretion protein
VAEAKLASVKAGPMPEEVAIAQAQVQQAKAALTRVEVQLDKLKLSAPRDGIITDRPANPGELATPGATLMNLGDLDQVTLTVFIPETQIGRVHVGQVSRVSVDAYPGETFEGSVTFIAPEAEFTPKNVQTEEERVNLVFAVKISLENPDHRLKPGMPADAEIVSDL